MALVSYVAVLWSLAGFELSVPWLGAEIVVPCYMIWLASLYVLVATGLTDWLGRPLKPARDHRQSSGACHHPTGRG